MTESAERPSKGKYADWIWVVALFIGVGVLFFLPAGIWGFWEPWETEFARMGRTLATGEDADWPFIEASGQAPW